MLKVIFKKFGKRDILFTQRSLSGNEMNFKIKKTKTKKTIVSIYIRVKYNAIQTIIVQLPAAVAEVE